MATPTTDELALREAAWNANNELVRVLLQRYQAAPNTNSKTGLTPLMEECKNRQACVEVVRLLLEAGADPAFASENGLIPLHLAAAQGRMDLVDMLYSRAPATLNCCLTNGETALYVACYQGHEKMVAKLLSLGAMQPMPLDAPRKFVCPLRVAVVKGFVGVVRILTYEGSMRAVGGVTALAVALTCAIQFRHATILRLLLTVGGEERRAKWANTCIRSSSLLHYATAFLYPAAVSLLLEAGADVAARDKHGRNYEDYMGAWLDRVGTRQDHAADEVAIRRMLTRGPAYRARSWAWALDTKANTGGCGDDDGGTATASIWSFLLALIVPRAISLRICRPKEKNNYFITVIARYCLKD